MPGKGTLYLIPTTIADETAGQVIPAHVTDNIRHIRHFLAEDVRTARRFLSSLKIFPSIEDLQFSVLDKHTSETELAEKLSPLINGNDVGVLSESGCPGVADP